MTANRIREIAFYYFSEYGYEGTSLAQLANEVGIKTPSLYAHFKSKEEIFFSCLEFALESDLQYFKEQLDFNNHEDIKQILYSFLIDYEERLKTKNDSMFCLRVLYSPPHEFKKQLILQTNERIAELGQLTHPLFERAKMKGELNAIKVEDAVEAYLCLFDGLIIEFLYAGSERFQYRLKSSWNVFTQGVFKNPVVIR